MKQNNKSLNICLFVLIAIALQILLVMFDNNDDPHKAVAEFTKSYFMLDTSIVDRVCVQNLVADGENVIKELIHENRIKAAEMGFDLNNMRYRLYNIETVTLKRDKESAQIKLTGDLRRAIHIPFSIIAGFFNLGKVHEFEKTFDLVKSHDKWEVCGVTIPFPEG